jgi:hypothetical protein
MVITMIVNILSFPASSALQVIHGFLAVQKRLARYVTLVSVLCFAVLLKTRLDLSILFEPSFQTPRIFCRLPNECFHHDMCVLATRMVDTILESGSELRVAESYLKTHFRAVCYLKVALKTKPARPCAAPLSSSSQAPLLSIPFQEAPPFHRLKPWVTSSARFLVPQPQL